MKIVPVILVSVLLAGAAGCSSDDSEAKTQSSAVPAALAATQGKAADNGVSALAADEILKKATTAIKGAKSYHFTLESKDESGTSTLDLDVTGTSIVGKFAAGEATAELLQVGTDRYVKPNAAYWTLAGGTESQAEAVDGSWVAVPADDVQTAALFDLTNPELMLVPSGTVTKGQATTITGVPVITLTDGGDQGTLYIATSGEPYPIQLVGADKTGTFSKFGETLPTATAPADDEIVDPSEN